MNRQSEMTPEERNLFRSFTIREDRLEAGNLTEPELRVLEQLRVMRELLRVKYPGSALEPVRLQPGWNRFSPQELTFRGSASELLCTAVLTRREDGSFSLADNYWGALVQEEACALARRLLPCARLSVLIRSLMGDEVREDLSFQEACRQRLPFLAHFRVTVLPNQLPRRLLEQWQELVEQGGLYGFFQFYLSTGDNSEAPLYLGSFSVPCLPRES